MHVQTHAGNQPHVWIPGVGWMDFPGDACTRRTTFFRVLGNLSQLAAQAFASNDDLPPERLNPNELDVLSLDLEALELHSRRWSFRSSSGRPGWLRLWGPLQGCPMVFIAGELAMAFGMWSPGERATNNWRIDDVYEPEASSLHARTHLSRALSLASAWRTWMENPRNADLRQHSEIEELCNMLAWSGWHILNNLAQAALRGIGCYPDVSVGVMFTHLIGCLPKFPKFADLCEAPVVQAPPVAGTYNGFWTNLLEKLMIRPTLQMQLGTRSGGAENRAPHLMASILPMILNPTGTTGHAIFLEFGVHNGSSINFIAGALKNAARKRGQRPPLIYGFDSFQGLPTYWRRVFGSASDNFAAGVYGLPKLPQVTNNVVLVPGWFNETLPSFTHGLATGLSDGSSPGNVGAEAHGNGDVWVRFLHVDCDLYTSTTEVLQGLASFFRHGTVLVFDELVNYPEFLDNELLALFEFLQQYRWSIRILYAPWLIIHESSEFKRLEEAGYTEGDLLQSAAFELLA